MKQISAAVIFGMVIDNMGTLLKMIEGHLCSVEIAGKRDVRFNQ